ncbi:NAD(P)-dependent oxidoreductase [Acaricomes phytoseiuli]|uniref:NAD(P)-dependent oxidoreductase n=1 Tax=Acaricomes phytoseiuli TaxID=291968 RepID=UPI000362FC79|nr:NAD(P)-dependent oxidoreductase [Acaricomes phytoseiuli]MCW1248946.1 NAD(P)-dependent oxidoreductase [Acaricomes phytoseiuli]
MNTNPTVAVLGLGTMGLPMAARLAETFPIRGYDIVAERRDLAAADGVQPVTTAEGAVTGADLVFLVVRDALQLEQVLFGSELVDAPTDLSAPIEGILAALAPGAVVVLCATVGVAPVRDVAARLAAHQIGLVDAPLSGGPVRARSGDLLIVVGAAPAVLAKAAPALDLLASTLSIVGERAGDGQALKTVNQLLCGIHIAAAAEALSLASAMGLDPERTLEALQQGAAASFMLGNRGPRMLQVLNQEQPEVLSRLDIFVKDMGIVEDAARQLGVATPLAATAEQQYLMGRSSGLGADDDSALIRLIAPVIGPGGTAS